MQTKDSIDQYHRLDLLWCSICLKDLTTDNTWIADDTQDNRIFCYDCAPDTAIRVKDLI